MDQKSRARLDTLLSKEIGSLTENDRAFLRARQSYLNPLQKREYASVIESAPVNPDSEGSSQTTEASDVNTKKKHISQMNRAELMLEAESVGVAAQVKPEMTNRDIIVLIESAKQ